MATLCGRHVYSEEATIERFWHAAGKLQTAALIHYGRGKITVLGRAKLGARVCECYAVVKREYDWLPSPKLFVVPGGSLIGCPSPRDRGSGNAVRDVKVCFGCPANLGRGLIDEVAQFDQGLYQYRAVRPGQTSVAGLDRGKCLDSRGDQPALLID